MCGIAGIVDLGAPVDPSLVTAMCDRIRHRGPDSDGLHAADGVALGIRRLSIIDVRGGDQPIYNEDGSVAVVMNGEIYNFADLREELVARGHRFATRSDTEVLVHLYEEHGDALVHRLRGMFAFALWDERRRRLLCARDRVGKKPLFYRHAGGRLTFGSELSAVLADPAVERRIDPRALDAYLALQYVPHPLTIFESVRKLPPASTLVVDSSGLAVERYWQLSYAPKRTEPGEAELAEELRSQLDEATRIRLVSEVPLGAFLSGGIDSSAVVASMAHQAAGPVRTFSISFGEQDFDETPYARLVAQQYGTEHHEFRVEPDALGLMPTMARHYGEPFADPSALPSFLLARLTGDHVTVALNGDGGDESFAGYGRYARDATLARLRVVPRPLRRLLGAAGAAWGPGERETGARSRSYRISQALSLPDPHPYLMSVEVFDADRRDALLAPAFAQARGSWRAEQLFDEAWADSSGERIDRLLELDVETYLPADLMVKVDIASMAYSLEARSPFLDHVLMEFAATLPTRLKLAGSSGKVLLKSAMRGRVPDAILDRPKMGFGVPLRHWFRGPVAELPEEMLLDPASCCRDYLDGKAIAALIAEHRSGAADHSMRLWTLLMLETWHREVLAGPVGDAVPVAG